MNSFQQLHLIRSMLKIGFCLYSLSYFGILASSYAQTSPQDEANILKDPILNNNSALQSERFKTLYRLARLHIEQKHPNLTIKTKFGVTINIDKYGKTIKGYPTYQVSDKNGKISTIMLEYLKAKKGWELLKQIED